MPEGSPPKGLPKGLPKGSPKGSPESFGFSIIGRKSGGEEIGRTDFALIRQEGLDFPEYLPFGLETPDGDDLFRIGKIVKAYQNIPEITETGEKRREEIGKLVSKYLGLLSGKRLSREKAELYERVVFSATGEGRGPLEFLVGDPQIEEIMVNGTSQPIFIFHRRFGMCATNLRFDSEEYLIEKANQLLFPGNKRVDSSKPFAHAILPNGDRISVEIPPLAKEPCIDIRKFSEKPMTLPELVKLGMLDLRAAAFLFLAVESGVCNIGVVGNTGAGKTTLLGALLRLAPPYQRVILVEEIPEISVPHKHNVRLVQVEHLGIGMAELVRETLRLRPDRVVVGEVRSPSEVQALRDSCLSGQAYSTYFTYHSESAQAAVERLESQGISRKDCEYFGLLVVCRRFEDRDGKTRRIVSEISEIGADGRTLPLFKHDFKRNRWIRRLRGKSRVEARLLETFISGKGGLSREIAKREKLLKRFSDAEDAEFFSGIWRAARKGG
ncbi:MAG: ATPase, T2SS/T4P/T4SS family [archaeon]